MPVTAIPLIIGAAGAAASVAGGVMSAEGQQSQAQAEQAFQQQQHAAITKAAKQNYYQSIAQTQNLTQQELMQQSQQSIATKDTDMQALGSEKTNLSAHGVAGNSVNSLLNEFGRIESTNQQTIATNFDRQQRQNQQSMLAAQATAQQQISTSIPQPVQFPNFAAIALGLAGNLGSTSANLLLKSNPNTGNPNQPDNGQPKPGLPPAGSGAGGSDF